MRLSQLHKSGASAIRALKRAISKATSLKTRASSQHLSLVCCTRSHRRKRRIANGCPSTVLPVIQAGPKLDIIVAIGEYFRREPVVGEVGLEPWNPMGPYILRAHAALLLLVVSASRGFPAVQETRTREKLISATRR